MVAAASPGAARGGRRARRPGPTQGRCRRAPWAGRRRPARTPRRAAPRRAGPRRGFLQRVAHHVGERVEHDLGVTHGAPVVGRDAEKLVAGEARQVGPWPCRCRPGRRGWRTVGVLSARRVTGAFSAWAGSAPEHLDLGEGGRERGHRAGGRAGGIRDRCVRSDSIAAMYCSTSDRSRRRTSPETRLGRCRSVRPCA